MKQKIVELSGRILTHFKNELEQESEITIFLCGGTNREEHLLRFSLGRQISRMPSKYTYSVYYPEDMFNDLISVSKLTNLLTLENMLGDSVHCVVILLNSPGAFTELGAFSNHDTLREKLVIVVDEKYQGSRSFISLGPLRFLKYKTESKVLYLKLHQDNLPRLSRQITKAAREIPKQPISTDFLSNAISSLRFYLALIYIFDPLPKALLLEIIKHLSLNDFDLVNTVADTIINYLTSRQQIIKDRGILSIAEKGRQNLFSIYIKRMKYEEMSLFFSNIRLEAMNLTMRK